MKQILKAAPKVCVAMKTPPLLKHLFRGIPQLRLVFHYFAKMKGSLNPPLSYLIFNKTPSGRDLQPSLNALETHFLAHANLVYCIL